MKNEQEADQSVNGEKSATLVKLKAVYGTIAPVPFNMAAEVIAQLDEQGWETQHMAFGGMVVETQNLTSLHKPQAVPSYILIVRKTYDESKGESKPAMPVINVGGKKL